MRNYGLVLVGLWGLVAGCGSKPAHTDLTVVGAPMGEVAGKGRVVLTFSRAMVAPARLERPLASAPIAVSPAIEGEAMWVDERTLAFLPTTSLPLSTRFTVTVPAGTKALDGHQLGAPHVFEFFTERLTGEIELVGSTERATRDQLVKLSFKHEVPFDQVAQHCGFSAGARQVPVKLAPDSSLGPARTFTVMPSTELTMDTAWKVACRAGLRGSVGNLGLAQPVEQAFRTFGALRFVGLEPGGDDIVPDESLRLALAFTNPLAPPYQMTLSPPAPGFPQRCHELGDKPGLSCAAQLDPRTSYTLTIDASQRDVFGQTLDKPQVLSFRTTDAQPTISVESGYFVAELKRPVLPVWTRNVKQLQVTAVEVTPANFHHLSPLIDWWDPAPADFSKSKLVPRQQQLAVAGAKNTWGQHPIGATELFGGVAGPGMYYIELGSTEVKRAPYEDGGRQKVLVNFTDIGVVSKLSGTRGLVWATRLSTGKPLPGASVSVRDAAGKVTWSGTTDGEGVAVLPGIGEARSGHRQRGRRGRRGRRRRGRRGRRQRGHPDLRPGAGRLDDGQPDAHRRAVAVELQRVATTGTGRRPGCAGSCTPIAASTARARRCTSRGSRGSPGSASRSRRPAPARRSRSRSRGRRARPSPRPRRG